MRGEPGKMSRTIAHAVYKGESMNGEYGHLYDTRGWVLVRGRIKLMSVQPHEIHAYGRAWPLLSAHFKRLPDGRIAVSPGSYSHQRLSGYAERHERVKRGIMRAIGARAVQRAKRADAKAKAAKQ